MPEEEAPLVVVLNIHSQSDSKLAHIGKAGRLPRFLPRLSKNRKENGGQNRDNRDYDKKFNESEC
jgi:hypothetical protein